ncbi:MAG TPA: phenylalanine--tRNA ligase beta subunit-related protein [Gemmataceae bacterium]|nr:phenylalanine--tRNA ligase beta subunit-related protein [Gemmataceae bacterium]
MTFIVTDDCQRLGLRAGAVVFRDVRIGPRDAALHEAIADEVQSIRARLESPQAIRSLPEVAAFRELLRRAGVNPRREQPSLERLLNYVLKRGDLPAINSLVDAYNLVSIRSCCSLGAHDLDAIELPVSLRLVTAADRFVPLGSDKIVSIPAGEFGYVDARGRVLCRLDVLQAEFSKVTVATTNVLLIAEGTAEHAPPHLRRTAEEVMETVTRYCGGTAEVAAWPE